MSVLSGVTVIEIGQVLSAPYAGAVLAGLGANVIKVERPGGGDDARRMGPAFRNGDAMNFHSFNHDKASVVLDLKTEEGYQALLTLLETADILVHNLRPGVVASLGLDGPSLCGRFGRLIYCEVSAFGHLGPRRESPGYEPLIQAYSGLSSINGGPGDPPIRLGISACDLGTGMWIVIGALAMLQRRSQTGAGGVVHASLLETALAWEGQKIDCWVNFGELPARHASGHPDVVPYQAFDGADAPFLVCCGNDNLFAKLAVEVGRPGWIDDPRFATNRDRLINKAPLLSELEALFRLEPRTVWLQRLQAAGIPSSPIQTIPEVLAEPQVGALGILQEVPGEDYRLTGLPISFDGVRPPIRRSAPKLGQYAPAPVDT